MAQRFSGSRASAGARVEGSLKASRIAAGCRMWAFGLGPIAAMVFACSSGSRSDATVSPDANAPVAVQDAGAAQADAGAPIALAQCDPSGPPADAGVLAVSIGDAALIAPPQAANWQSVSTAPECATIAPRDVPRMHSWLGPDATKFAPYCDPPMIDDAGNYSAFSLSDLGSYTFFLPSDGSAGATMLSFANDLSWRALLRARAASGCWNSRVARNAIMSRPSARMPGMSARQC